MGERYSTNKVSGNLVAPKLEKGYNRAKYM